MKISIKQIQNFQLEASSESGVKVNLDAAKSIGGTGNGFRPMELVLVSLASCASIDVLMIINKYQKPYSNFGVEVEARRREEIPKVFTDIILTFSLESLGITMQQLFRAVELSIQKYCSVSAMLLNDINITAKVSLNGKIDKKVVVRKSH